VAVGELLFQLTGQALLDFVEADKEGDGDEDDYGLFAVADFELELKESSVEKYLLIALQHIV
jgi:hypothetical protein